MPLATVTMQVLEDSLEGKNNAIFLLCTLSQLDLFFVFCFLDLIIIRISSLVSPLASSGFASPYGAQGGNYLQGEIQF